jgi:hypothetical protein
LKDAVREHNKIDFLYQYDNMSESEFYSTRVSDFATNLIYEEFGETKILANNPHEVRIDSYPYSNSWVINSGKINIVIADTTIDSDINFSVDLYIDGKLSYFDSRFTFADLFLHKH